MGTPTNFPFTRYATTSLVATLTILSACLSGCGKQKKQVGSGAGTGPVTIAEAAAALPTVTAPAGTEVLFLAPTAESTAELKRALGKSYPEGSFLAAVRIEALSTQSGTIDLHINGMTYSVSAVAIPSFPIELRLFDGKGSDGMASGVLGLTGPTGKSGGSGEKYDSLICSSRVTDTVCAAQRGSADRSKSCRDGSCKGQSEAAGAANCGSVGGMALVKVCGQTARDSLQACLMKAELIASNLWGCCPENIGDRALSKTCALNWGSSENPGPRGGSESQGETDRSAPKGDSSAANPGGDKGSSSADAPANSSGNNAGTESKIKNGFPIDACSINSSVDGSNSDAGAKGGEAVAAATTGGGNPCTSGQGALLVPIQGPPGGADESTPKTPFDPARDATSGTGDSGANSSLAKQPVGGGASGGHGAAVHACPFPTQWVDLVKACASILSVDPGALDTGGGGGGGGYPTVTLDLNNPNAPDGVDPSIWNAWREARALGCSLSADHNRPGCGNLKPTNVNGTNVLATVPP